MTYQLRFEKRARRDWDKLDPFTQKRLKKKLAAVLENPHIAANRVRGYNNLYKIKLLTPAYRLSYSVDDQIVTVTMLIIGAKDKTN